ncbi:hypothetical protein O6H91_18G032300 [Diphasiastrum complanatum]|uniref:Uncharacterized protein n=1 Tax=Diphasiastrum complanatum TaxID=34168 RepID=A0ACC2AZN7_DIPCM|nr:hypothetical protein O6H91_Y062800 [Diphasiastrum complanatum]KAJ7522952.1 hypothetical protein O6H91_18G032300 [Diphasiastrum complanatum]
MRARASLCSQKKNQSRKKTKIFKLSSFIMKKEDKSTQTTEFSVAKEDRATQATLAKRDQSIQTDTEAAKELSLTVAIFSQPKEALISTEEPSGSSTKKSTKVTYALV